MTKQITIDDLAEIVQMENDSEVVGFYHNNRWIIAQYADGKEFKLCQLPTSQDAENLVWDLTNYIGA